MMIEAFRGTLCLRSVSFVEIELSITDSSGRDLRCGNIRDQSQESNLEEER